MFPTTFILCYTDKALKSDLYFDEIIATVVLKSYHIAVLPLTTMSLLEICLVFQSASNPTEIPRIPIGPLMSSLKCLVLVMCLHFLEESSANHWEQQCFLGAGCLLLLLKLNKIKSTIFLVFKLFKTTSLLGREGNFHSS